MWIYERKGWPNFTWDEALIAPQLADIRYKQGLLLGKMSALGFELKAEASLNTLTRDVVKSSKIEGEILDAKEVRSSIASRLGLKVAGMVPVGRNVDGVVQMMLDATLKYQEPLTKERLFAWHAALFPTGYSGLVKITVGSWRPESAGKMQVVSGRAGYERVHFEAPSALKLDSEMRSFLKMFEEDHKTDPVLKAAIVHLWFVTIHPFEDGNGRIGRALADMALARADGTSDRFYSMSAQIEAERSSYYEELERQQKSDTDITPWLSWFLTCFGKALEKAEKSLSAVLFKSKFWQYTNHHPLNERQRLVLNRMLEENFEGYINTSKFSKLAKCSTDTALRDLTQLLSWGVLIKNPGAGRSTSYRLIDVESF